MSLWTPPPDESPRRLADLRVSYDAGVLDESHLHAGHAGAREGRHFHVRIVSDKFQGLPRLKRHRLVYDCLGPLAPQGIHALAIDARAPGET